MEITWLSLLPPLIVVIAAFWSKNLNKSLFAGIVSAGLIATQFSPISTIQLMKSRFWGQIIDVDKFYLYIFLLAIAALVTLYNQTGCAISLAHLIVNKVRKARTIQFSSMLISISLFIDDYLSILATGFVMSPIMDRFSISRYKLAFLVHSLAGAVVILAPVSSWVAAITVYLNEAGIDVTHSPQTIIYADPFYIYLKTLPFMFYSFLIIGSAWLIVQKNISFGPIGTHEKNTLSNPIIHTNTDQPTHSVKGALINLLAPLFVLISTMFVGMLYAGGYSLFGGENSFMESIKNNKQSFLIMAISSLFALSIGLFISLYRKAINAPQITTIIVDGYKLMRSALIMVFLAAVLGIMLKEDIQTGHYLASLLPESMPMSLLPVMFFVVSLITTMATGGAWATFAIMLSIGIPMLVSLLNIATPAAPEALPILFPIIGAIFSGAICGDHISPLSETTVMTATSTGTDPLEHAYSQVFYTIPAIFSSMLAFIISGYLAHYPVWINVGISLGIATCTCFGALLLLNQNKKSA